MKRRHVVELMSRCRPSCGRLPASGQTHSTNIGPAAGARTNVLYPASDADALQTCPPPPSRRSASHPSLGVRLLTYYVSARAFDCSIIHSSS